MKKLEWYSWISAPKDGSHIIALHSDYSGAPLLYYGEDTDENPGWVTADGEFEGDDIEYAGWIPCPHIPIKELKKYSRFGEVE